MKFANNYKSIQSISLLLVISIIATALAGIASIQIASKFYSIYPFHYDSASYLYQALFLYHQLELHGLSAQLYEVLRAKDNLGLLLGTLFYPRALNQLFGHMYFLLPMMASFIFLLSYYIYTNTKKYSYVIVSVLCLFAFSYMFNPYLGISDYWKDNLAIWLLGDALICILLSSFLSKQAWSIAAGIFFGLLFWQRSVLGVYFTILLVPLLLVCLKFNIKNYGSKKGFFNLINFCLPALLIIIPLILLQSKTLYRYYFIANYAYASWTVTANLVLSIIKQYAYFPVIFLFCSIIVNYISAWNFKNRDLFITLWFILGFLGVIILLKTLYFEVGNVIWVLITIGFSTSLISLHHSQIKFIRSVGLFFYAAIFIVSAGLLYITFVHNPGSYYPYPSTKSWKDVFSKILNICGTYNCEHVAFLSSENVGPFLIQARFDNNVNIISSNTINSLSVTGFMSQHDTYFTANGLFKNNQPTTEKIMEIAKVNLNKIQMSRKPLAITYCNSENARKSPAFGADGKNIALPYAIASLKLIQQNSEWKLIKKTESPNGCLAIYSLVPKA